MIHWRDHCLPFCGKKQHVFSLDLTDTFYLLDQYGPQSCSHCGFCSISAILTLLTSDAERGSWLWHRPLGLLSPYMIIRREVCRGTPGWHQKEWGLVFFPIIMVSIKSDRNPSTNILNRGWYQVADNMCQVHGHWQSKSASFIHASKIFYMLALFSMLTILLTANEILSALVLSMLLKENSHKHNGRSGPGTHSVLFSDVCI